jgi:serine/threonine protein kinase
MFAEFLQSLTGQDELSVSVRDWDRIHLILSTTGAGTSLEQLRVILRSVIVCSDRQHRAFDRHFDRFFAQSAWDRQFDFTAALADFRVLAGLPESPQQSDELAIQTPAEEPSRVFREAESTPVPPGSPLPASAPSVSIDELDSSEFSEWLNDQSAYSFDAEAQSYFTMGMVRRDAGPMLSRTELQEAADSLGFFQSDAVSTELDVDRSVTSTLEGGGYPVPEFHHKRKLLSVVVLVDSDADPCVWNTVPAELVQGLARHGVAAQLYRFHGVPETIVDAMGRISCIDDLEDLRNQLVVLIVTDGHGMFRRRMCRPLEQLSRWPRVAFLDPRPPELWDLLPEIALRFQLPVYACDAEGVINCLKRFASETGRTVNSPVGRFNVGIARNILPGECSPTTYLEEMLTPLVLQWAQACAVVPSTISIGLADHLRRSLFPEIAPTRIANLIELDGSRLTAGGIRFSDRIRDALLSGFQKQSPLFQQQVAEYLSEQIVRFTEQKTSSGKPGLGELQGRFLSVVIRSLAAGEDMEPAELVRLWKVTELSGTIRSTMRSLMPRIQNAPVRRVAESKLRPQEDQPLLTETIEYSSPFTLGLSQGSGSIQDSRSIPQLELVGSYTLLKQIDNDGRFSAFVARKDFSEAGPLDTLYPNVALRLLKAPFLDEAKEREQIADHAKRFASVSHGNLETIYEVSAGEKEFYLVSELCGGNSLQTVISREILLPVQTACRIIADVAAGLQELHQHEILHHDIRPSKILVDLRTVPQALSSTATFQLTTELQSTILFGAPPFTSDDRSQITITGFFRQPSLLYISPESCVDARSASPISDVYSLMAVLYHLITGWPPRQEVKAPGRTIDAIYRIINGSLKPVRQLCEQCPADLARLITRALDSSPNQRPPLAEIISGLTEYASKRTDPHEDSHLELFRTVDSEKWHIPKESEIQGLRSRIRGKERAIPDRIGHYRIQQQLGRGQFGTVYVAFDEDLHRRVAVKVPNLTSLTTQEVEMFLNEARSVASVRHPAIVTVYSIGRLDDGTCYIVSELIEGGDLKKYMASRKTSPDTCSAIITQLAKGLHCLHKAGIVHRDVKPSNILIGSDGQPFLTDFGLAVHERRGAKDGMVVGTPAYMSPEQIRAEPHLVDGRSDIFSLGVVMYEMLTGRRPFQSPGRNALFLSIQKDAPPPLRTLDPAIPAFLEQICLKCLSKSPDDRYATAEDLATALQSQPQSSLGSTLKRFLGFGDR